MSRPLSARPGRAGWPEAILFDLDGTLIDSAPDLHAAVDELLARHKLGPLGLGEVKGMIGNGVEKLVQRAFAACGREISGSALKDEYAAMMRIYGGRLTELTTLMPGARETAEFFRRAGVAMGVVTNKPEAAARAILDHFGLSPLLSVVVGGDSGLPKKPAPEALLKAVEELGATPANAWLVGDGAADVQAARAAGMAVALVRGGYTVTPVEELGADLVCDRLSALPGALSRSAKVEG